MEHVAELGEITSELFFVKPMGNVLRAIQCRGSGEGSVVEAGAMVSRAS
jgi:hypothetical protein